MAKIITRVGTRCGDHPHRPATERCTHCGYPFCRECLTPTERAADGTRSWLCGRCAAAIAVEAAAAAHARTLRGRLERLREAGRPLLPGVAVVALLGVLAAVSLPYLGPSAALQSTCGELTRIRSVGAIGVPGAAEAINFLTYPHRAGVRLLPSSAEVPAADGDGGAAAPDGSPSGGVDALVDECDSGWRSAPDIPLPVAVVLEVRRESTWLQRLAFWQDPRAPRGTWVQDFEALASPSEAGDDFRPLTLDRPPRLLATVEQQWFEVVRPAPSTGSGLLPLSPEERVRYGQPFPDAVPVRRLLLRILSTHGDGSGEASGHMGAVSLGEVAAYGPDLEITINDVYRDGARTDDFVFAPNQIPALAGRPTSILLINRSFHAHTFVTVGQDRNLELRVEPGQAVSGQFVAASRTGRYEFFCRLPGHATRGGIGSIVVR